MGGPVVPFLVVLVSVVFIPVVLCFVVLAVVVRSGARRGPCASSRQRSRGSLRNGT